MANSLLDVEQRTLLANLSSDLQNSESRMFGQIESTFKWLLATLWASNAGALAATIGSNKFNEKIGHYPLIFFAAGMILSMLMGILNLLFASRAVKPLVDLKNIFVIGSSLGQFDTEEVKALSDRISKTTVYGWPLWLSGVGSLVLLIMGIAVAGFRVW